MAGNAIEGRRRADHETFRVSVRLDNGSVQTVTQENISDLHTADRVRVEGNLNDPGLSALSQPERGIK